ncbi:MAG: ABC transporter substrate-binding protein [Methyloprofundus sp.]|nr:ABC transporter substrate-binding protein [Methyloprofundus sp.]
MQAKPQKVVSINLCTDQLLMQLADKETIASVSHLAVRDDVSAMAKEAVGIRQNHGLAEEIMLMQPDLILAGTFTSRPTVFLLKRLGFNLIELPVAKNFTDIRQNIMTVAKALDEVQRGTQLVQAFDKRLTAALASQSKMQAPVAVFYRENSYTTGDDTLAHTILEAAGFRNLAAQLGMSGSGHMPLETLITHKPDIAITGRKRSRKGTVARAAFHHPAFKYFKTDKAMVKISDPLWVCGTPLVLDAVANLVNVRLRLTAAKHNIGHQSQ